MKCRHCEQPLAIQLADLGAAPASNAYLKVDDLSKPEKWYPLKVLVCTCCWLAQTEDYTEREALFSPDYAYFSSYSDSWLAHCQQYATEVKQRFNLTSTSMVGEIAANDGYLLQYFQHMRIPCFGVEPTEGTAAVARQKGIHIFMEFFGRDCASKLQQQGYAADLLIANNVLAHVPDINDFVCGFSRLLKPTGVATFEFPHLYHLIDQCQFDTIYHEHFSYLSLTSVQHIFEKNGLTVFDVTRIPTHGGSLRVFAQRSDTGMHSIMPSVEALLAFEQQAGLTKETTYTSFQTKMAQVKREFVTFLMEAQLRGEKVVGYGAAAKGNTLLNYAGTRPDLLSYVVDRNPSKQGKFLPGSRIPIVTEQTLQADKPDWIVILPWNLREEVSTQLAYAREWGAKFVTAVPCLNIF